MSSYYNHETHTVEWDGTVDGDLNDRYYLPSTRPQRYDEEELAAIEAEDEAVQASIVGQMAGDAARATLEQEAIDGAFPAVPASPVGDPVTEQSGGR